MGRKHQHDAAAQRGARLVVAGAPGRNRDDPAALGQLPAETGSFADVVLGLRISDERRCYLQDAAIGSEIPAGVGAGHHLP